MNSDPQYPVIAISAGDSFFVLREPIAKCSAYAWRNGYFDDLVFFDCGGRLWPVRASLRTPLGFFDRFRRAVAVDLEFGEPTAEAQAAAVALLETLIDEDETDLYDQFLPHPELKALFRAARTPAELISAAEHLGGDVANGFEADDLDRME